MKTKLRFLLLPLAALVSFQCDDEDSPKINCNTQTFVKSITNKEGKIKFDTSLNTYVITAVIAGSIDAVDLGIVCDLQKDLRQNGLSVIFDGSYYVYDGVRPELGGHTYYYLDASRIIPK